MQTTIFFRLVDQFAQLNLLVGTTGCSTQSVGTDRNIAFKYILNSKSNRIYNNQHSWLEFTLLLGLIYNLLITFKTSTTQNYRFHILFCTKLSTGLEGIRSTCRIKY